MAVRSTGVFREEAYTVHPSKSGIYSLRKEVIQPQLPLRLPCYDFVPITSPTFGDCLPDKSQG